MALLRIEAIRAGYGHGPDILNGLSLELEPNRIYCVIGPNGAGKSTLLRVIMGLLRPRAGRVWFNKEDITGLRPDQIVARGISYVPQDRSLFPDMTVWENLLMGGYLMRDPRALSRRVEEILELFPVLRKHRSRRAGLLSGGEQQMLAIGRALILRPALLLLDEPSLGLAPLVVEQVFEIIRQLKAMSLTVLLVEQNVRKGLECADWGYVLDQGCLRFEGPAKAILEEPRLVVTYFGQRRGHP